MKQPISFPSEHLQRTAVISGCGQYRYRLGRIWDQSKPGILFIMLNPSAADGFRDDPTIRRCMGFAREWGYGSLSVGNLFAWRSHKPADLLLSEDPAGPENQQHLEDMAKECESIICAWGNEGTLKKLGSPDGRFFLPPALMKKSLRIIKLSRNDIPVHPLYQAAGLKPIFWEQDIRT